MGRGDGAGPGLARGPGAADWAKHFRWALCKAARVEGFPYSAPTQKEAKAYQPWR